MKDEPVRNLWIRFKGGSDQALSMLYSQYVNALYSYGLKICNDEHLVKDCIQEIFIRLIDKRSVLQISEKTHLYLFRSLRNKLLEEIRSRHRREKIGESLTLDSDNTDKNAEETLVSSEEEQKIRKLLDAAFKFLSDRQREAIFLRFTENLDYGDIAEILEIDIASARTLIYRALKKIKDGLVKTTLILFMFFSERMNFRFPARGSISIEN